MHHTVQHIADRQKEWEHKVSPILGKRVKNNEKIWVLSGVNDLGIPYFSKPGRKKLYILRRFGLEWLQQTLSELT